MGRLKERAEKRDVARGEESGNVKYKRRKRGGGGERKGEYVHTGCIERKEGREEGGGGIVASMKAGEMGIREDLEQ